MRSFGNYAIEEEASSHHETTPSPAQHVPISQSAPSIQPALTEQPQGDVVSQLLPTFRTVQEALQQLIGSQTIQAPAYAPAPLVVGPVDEPVHGITLANDDNLPAAQ